MKDKAGMTREEFLKKINSLGIHVNVMGREAYEKRMAGKDENSWLFQPKKEQEKPVMGDFFTGFPYLLIRIVRSLFHINLLSVEQNNPENLFRLAQAQADANKLPVCLLTNENVAVHFSSTSRPNFSDEIPKRLILITGRLRLSVNQLPDADLLQREKELEDFIKSAKQTGYLTGNLYKGGRKATEEELIRLQGVQENGLPKGVVICPTCGDYRGECLDQSLMQPGMGILVKVACYCDNDNLCAYCGKTLGDRKLNSNRYEPKDGKIWHRPGFSGLDHRCSEASNNA
jgi:hypothetical protein